jgi:hypothetical protein
MPHSHPLRYHVEQLSPPGAVSNLREKAFRRFLQNFSDELISIARFASLREVRAESNKLLVGSASAAASIKTFHILLCSPHQLALREINNLAVNSRELY